MSSEKIVSIDIHCIKANKVIGKCKYSSVRVNLINMTENSSTEAFSPLLTHRIFRGKYSLFSQVQNFSLSHLLYVDRFLLSSSRKSFNCEHLYATVVNIFSPLLSYHSLECHTNLISVVATSFSFQVTHS